MLNRKLPLALLASNIKSLIISFNGSRLYCITPSDSSEKIKMTYAYILYKTNREK